MRMDGIFFNRADHGTTIARAAGTNYNPTTDNCIARVTSKGNLMGGMIYTNYTGRRGSIVMHAAAFKRNWGCRKMLWMVFDYPFNQLGVAKIITTIPNDNVHARIMADRFGFELETVIWDVFPDGSDLAVFGMYRDRCRFLSMTPYPETGRGKQEHCSPSA